MANNTATCEEPNRDENLLLQDVHWIRDLIIKFNKENRNKVTQNESAKLDKWLKQLKIVEGYLRTPTPTTTTHISAHLLVAFLLDNPAIQNLFKILTKLEQFEDALSLMNKIYKLRNSDTSLGSSHPDTLKAQSELAFCLSHLQERDQALDLYRIVYNIQSQTLGPDHFEALVTQYNIGVVLQKQEKYDKALIVFDTVYRKRRESCVGVSFELGSNCLLKTLEAQFGIAYCWNSVKKYRKALHIFREIFITRSRIMGPHHSETLLAQFNIGVVLEMQRKYSKSLQIYKQVYEIQKEENGNFGPNHLDTLNTQFRMGFCHLGLDEFEAALDLYRVVGKNRMEILGADHQDTMWAEQNIGVVCEIVGRYEEAFTISEKLYGKRLSILGPDHLDTISSQLEMGLSLIGLGKYKEALSLLEFVKEKRNQILGRFHHREGLKWEKHYISKAKKGGEKSVNIVPDPCLSLSLSWSQSASQYLERLQSTVLRTLSCDRKAETYDKSRLCIS